jgi:diguanylate cyclase (GGDEF)-like protein
MPLDINSLLCVLMINLITIAVALPAVMGKVNMAARHAHWAVALQAGGWVALLVSGLLESGSWADRLVSSSAIACLGGGLALLGSAFEQWCGRDGRGRGLWVIAMAAALGYSAGFGNYPFRVGWANGLLALQMGWVAASVVRRPLLPAGRWRWVLVTGLLAQMVVTAWRGVLGAFFTDLYPRFLAPHPVNFAAAIVANGAALLTLLAILLAHRDEAARELERLATIDGLTGVLNRRAWLARATQELASSVRYERAVAVLMIDVDHFKKINDTRGHDAGDRALCCMARALQSSARAGDVVGRYGGEEFCVLMSHADDAAARAYDRRLRDNLARTAAQELGFAIDYSAGIAKRARADDTLAAMLKRADAMLYRAKALGRARTLDDEDVLPSAA